MKKAICLVFLLVYSISLPHVGYAAESKDATAESVVGLLVDMLVENGTLTQEQARTVAQRVQWLDEEVERVKQEEAEKIRKLEQTVQWLDEQVARARQKEAQERMRASREQTEQDLHTMAASDDAMKVSWDDGLRFESRDGNFETKIGGRIIADTLNTFSHGDLPNSIRPSGDFNNRNDMAYIRSARLNIEGTLFEDYFYNFEYEFDGDINTKTEVDGLRDMYMGMKDIPFIGSVSVGHTKEPFGLEESTSRSNITFLERSLADVFSPGFSWGVGIKNAVLDDRVTYGVGMFHTSDKSGTTSYGNAWNLTTRVTGLPWYEGKDKLLHLGTSYSLRNPKEGGFSGTGNTDDSIRFRQRPDMYTRDHIVDTGALKIDQENRLGLEGAFMYGPFSMQGEFIQTWLDPYDPSLKTGHLYGGYGSVSYILTGEHREYDKNDGRFQGVIPYKNFSLKNFSLKNFSLMNRTWGAWEIAARWSYLSLDDDDMSIDGGKAFATTVGLNWYLNPNMRIMLNWVHSERRDTDGAIDGIQLRMQVDF
jgi:phosphate-selective porin OprO and OprP